MESEDILHFLKQNAGTPFSDRHVSKAVDLERYRKDSSWAKQYLKELAHQKKIINAPNGFYFPEPEEKKHGEPKPESGPEAPATAPATSPATVIPAPSGTLPKGTNTFSAKDFAARWKRQKPQ